MSGVVEPNDYMAFGISGSQEKSQMLGSDIAVAYIIDGIQGFVADYNITSLAPVSLNLLMFILKLNFSCNFFLSFKK